jgi:lipoprotein-releasing system permease protein
VFELQLALKYLLPKKRSLSTALISLISVVVISLVVWLVLVFLSVTSGIERNWLSKLTALQAPLRISPTEAYYRSYYYQIDGFASASNFTLKTIGEKALSAKSDPYAEEKDIELPAYFPKKSAVDPVKAAVHELEQLKLAQGGLRFQDFEVGGALLKLQMHREGRISWLSQMSYLLSLSDENPHLASLLLPEGKSLVENGRVHLPDGPEKSILLPKSYQTSGVVVGDKGFISYSAPSAASSQEQRILITVAGFYDPGFLSLGNRCILVPHSVTQTLHGAIQTTSPDGTPTNGFFVWTQNVAEVKEQLLESFQRAGISEYWSVASFDEYESSRDLLQQFRSDRLLFTLIGTIVLLVACCNVISLLILLVNDKKKEIAILQSLGAKPSSIALLFGSCGAIIGLLSAGVGVGLALLTLNQLDAVVSFLSAVQGRAAFNPLFFGQNLPSQMSSDALVFVLIATPFLSLLAGLIPALKACRIRPSEVLRSE